MKHNAMATDHAVMVELQLLCDDMARFTQEMHEQFADIKERLDVVERNLADVRRSQTEFHQSDAHLAMQIADLDRRLDRIEQHLSRGA